MKKSLSLLLSIIIVFLSLTPLTSLAQQVQKDKLPALTINSSVKITDELVDNNIDDEYAYFASFTAPQSKIYEFNIDSRLFYPDTFQYESLSLFLYILKDNGAVVSLNYFSKTNPFVCAKLTKGETYYVAFSGESIKSIKESWHNYRDLSYSDNLTVKEHTHSIKRGVRQAYFRYDPDLLDSPPDKPCYVDGHVYDYCTKCYYYNKTIEVITSPKKIILSKQSYTYDGKVKKPSVTIKDKKGNVVSSKYYDVHYYDYKNGYGSKKTNFKDVGVYYVSMVAHNGTYDGSLTTKYRINPKSTSLKSLKKTSNGIKVSWNKQATQTTGYQIQYSTNKSFKNAKLVIVPNNKTLSKQINGLKKGKRYYVRIRTYKTVYDNVYDNKERNCVSSWSGYRYITL